MSTLTMRQDQRVTELSKQLIGRTFPIRGQNMATFTAHYSLTVTNMNIFSIAGKQFLKFTTNSLSFAIPIEVNMQDHSFTFADMDEVILWV